MRIDKVEIRKLALPMTNGFTISSAGVTHKETVITKLYTEDGLTGYGESSSFSKPIFNNETNDSTVKALKNILAPKVVGKIFKTPGDFIASYRNIDKCFSARLGIECAFWHLFSQYENKSLSSLLGGVKTKIEVGESIGIKNTVDETLNEIDLRLNEGYRRIKVKIKPGWDIELVNEVRKKWPDIVLTVDANSSYKYAEHSYIFRILDKYGLSMIEQPFGKDRVADHAGLQKEIKTPICLDESINSLDDLKNTLKVGACKIVNIKPVRVGGMIESIKIHDYAASQGVGVFCGGMLETGIGRAFNIALASKSNFIYAADMSPYNIFYSEDLIDPSYTVNSNGYIDVPKSVGLGYEIREDLIEKYTVHKVTI